MKHQWFVVLLCPFAFSATAQNASDIVFETPSAATDTGKNRSPLALSGEAVDAGYFSTRRAGAVSGGLVIHHPQSGSRRERLAYHGPPEMRLEEKLSGPQAAKTPGRILAEAYAAAAALFLLAMGVLLGLRHARWHKQRVVRRSREALMQEQLDGIRLHEAALQHEVESKTRELTAYALNFIQKSQFLEELKARVAQIRRQANGTLAGELRSLQQLLHSSSSLDKDWEEFHLYFEQVHDRFVKELNVRYPGLSSRDFRLCALLKLKLSTKEMASILGISPSSVKMARYRLRKKLQLAPEDDLCWFIINIDRKSASSRRNEAKPPLL